MNAAGKQSTTAPDLQLQSLGRLAGGMAHDVNNLLLVIRDYVDSASRALDSGDLRATRDELAGATDTVDRAGRMTQGLLSAFSPRPGPMIAFHLNDILDSMETLLREVAGPGVDLVLERGSDVPDLTGTPALIEQVILNLVLNARDAVGGRGRIVLTTSALSLNRPDAESPAALHAILGVSDNGSGMDEQTRARAFEPFFTTKSGTTGSGLGLTTVREIVTRHGGDVRIYDGLPGTTVTVLLPVAVAATPDSPV